MSVDAYRHQFQPSVRQGAPLLVLLHGTGGNAADLLPLGSLLLPEASLLAPDGDVSEHGAPRFFRRTGEGIYDMYDLARATDKLTGFVRAHRDALAPSAVIGLGYSNGANILAASLFVEPSLWDAGVLMHPLIPFEPEIAARLEDKPLLMTAGQRDPICPPALTSRLAASLKAAGAVVALEWHEGGHELRESEVEAASSFLKRWRTGKTGDAR